LLGIAREYKRRGLPIDVIVVDFFHWPKQGEWKFDPVYWPDPDAMIKELKQMGIELMVSVWPTVDKTCENYDEMQEKGYLIRTERGTFCPVMRLHGDREPRQPQYGTTGGASCCSGADNEVWSYGEEVYNICVKYMNIRKKLRDYTRKLMKELMK